MIHRELFGQRMALLATRVGRELDGPTMAEYHRILSAKLTNEQFLAAMALAFATWPAEYRNWPSPLQIVEMVSPVAAPTLAGSEAFERLLSLTNDPRVSEQERTGKRLELGPAAARAYFAVGGSREFRNILEADVKWLRAKFLDVYAEACEHANAESGAQLALEDANERFQQLVRATAVAIPSPTQKSLTRGSPNGQSS